MLPRPPWVKEGASGVPQGGCSLPVSDGLDCQNYNSVTAFLFQLFLLFVAPCFIEQQQHFHIITGEIGKHLLTSSQEDDNRAESVTLLAVGWISLSVA